MQRYIFSKKLTYIVSKNRDDRILQIVTWDLSTEKRKIELQAATKMLSTGIFCHFMRPKNVKAITLHGKVIAFISSFDSFYIVKR